MTRTFEKILLLLFLAELLGSGTLYCQTEKQLVPSDLKQQTIVTEPVTLYKGFLRIGAVANYRVADKYFSDDCNKEYFSYNVWGSKSSFNLTLQYGLNDRMEIGVVTEYMNNRVESQSVEVDAGTNTSTTVQTTQKGIGFGDTHLDIKYQLVREKTHRVSLTSQLGVTLPTGEKNPKNVKSAQQYDLPVGTGNYAATASLFARAILYPYSFTAYLKYIYNFSGSKKIYATDVNERNFRFGNRYETGVSTNLHLNDWIVMSNDIYCFYEGKGTIDNVVSASMPVSWSVAYVPNLVFQVKKFRLSEAVSIPVWGRNVPADPLFVLRMQYIF
jgi:hypothetical protein